MAEYISREDAVIVADYAADEHPYDKTLGKPETFSEYNQGWHDACDYIRNRLENLPAADVEAVRHGEWNANYEYEDFINADCSVCGKKSDYMYKYCPFCGARMDGGNDNGN